MEVIYADGYSLPLCVIFPKVYVDGRFDSLPGDYRIEVSKNSWNTDDIGHH